MPQSARLLSSKRPRPWPTRSLGLHHLAFAYTTAHRPQSDKRYSVQYTHRPFPPHSDRRRQRSCTALSSSCLGIRYPTHPPIILLFDYAFHRSCLLSLLDLILRDSTTYLTSLFFQYLKECYLITPLTSFLLADAARTHYYYSLTHPHPHLQTPQPINNSHAISQPAAANSTLSCLIEPEVAPRRIAHSSILHFAYDTQYLPNCLHCKVVIITSDDLDNRPAATNTKPPLHPRAYCWIRRSDCRATHFSTSLRRRTRYCTTVHHKLTHFAPHPPCSGAFWKPSLAWNLFFQNCPTKRARQGTACLPFCCDVRRARIARIPARILPSSSSSCNSGPVLW